MQRKFGMRITSSILKERGVCQSWRRKFRKKFPRNLVYITQRECEDRAQIFPWDLCAEKLLNTAGLDEYRKHKMILHHLEHRENSWSVINPLSTRALNFAKASLFGKLAQQPRFDPARA